MNTSKRQRVCLTPQPEHVGGPASFISRMGAALERRGIEVSHDLDDGAFDAVLLVGGTRHLGALRRARQSGARVVQRLAGLNWLHRVRPSGLLHTLKATRANALLAMTRRSLVDHVVYQSQFVQDWWQAKFQAGPPSSAIYNGVDLEQFSPLGGENPPGDRIRVLIVEGRLGGGYEFGLHNALALAGRLASASQQDVELVVAAAVEEAEKARTQAPKSVELNWMDLVEQADLPALYRSSHMLFSADILPACPNSVIEALACGTPVLAFETGALGELVTRECGRLADYGGDPWELEAPDIAGLVAAAQELLDHRDNLSAGARARAEAVFGLDQMVDDYLQVLFPDG